MDNRKRDMEEEGGKNVERESKEELRALISGPDDGGIWGVLSAESTRSAPLHIFKSPPSTWFRWFGRGFFELGPYGDSPAGGQSSALSRCCLEVAGITEGHF